MKKKILLLIANIMIFAMPLLATTTESDTIWTRNLLPGDIKGCAFTLTGDSIIAISGEGGGDSLYILEIATGNILKRVGIRPWSWEFIHFNTKSWIAITAFPEDGGLYIYDYINDKVINDSFGIYGFGKALTKDDKTLIVQNNGIDNKNVTLYDIDSQIAKDSLSTNYGYATTIALSPDNNLLAIGSGNDRKVNPDPENPEYEEDRTFNKIIIFNFTTKEIVKEFDEPYGTEGMIRDMKFSPDGKYLGVAKLDGSVRVYDVINMELYRKFIITGFANDKGPWKVSFTKNSNYILNGLFLPDYKTRVWDIKKNELIKILNEVAFTGLDASTKDSILVSSNGQITLLMPNILTDIKEYSEIKVDTLSLTILKTKNPIFELNYKENIKFIKLFNYSGQEIIQNNILQINNEKVRIDAEYLEKGVYLLLINDNSKPIKILVTE